MKRVWPIAAMVAALTAACLATAPAQSALASTPSPPARQVTLVLAPYLTWDDVTAASTPALWRLASRGALASVNARSRVRQPGQGATPLESALAVSAGAWALPEWGAPAAYEATETYAEGTAADAYRRIYGHELGTAAIAYLGLPMTQRANAAATADIVLGTLGEAVVADGGLTAAIGNSDTGFSADDALPQRPAAVAAMNASGAVLYGQVSPELLMPSAASPWGRKTDLWAFQRALDRVTQLARSHDGPSLVVLDAGDLSRAHDYADQVTDEVAQRQRAEALATLDRVVALADRRTGEGGVVIVASQALFEDAQGSPQGLGPLVIAGPGFSGGYATSSSTHRRGLVTNVDLTATVLDVLGIARPVQVLGNPMTAVPGPSDVATRVERLGRTNNRYIAIDSLKMPVATLLLITAVSVFSLTVLASWLASRLSARAIALWSAVLRFGLLFLLAVPLSASVSVLLTPTSGTGLALWSVFLLGALALAGAMYAATGGMALRVPAAALSLLTAALLLVDQLLGAPLSIVSLLSYSPLLGARYYGMGNEAAAIAFGALLVGSALLLDEWPEGGRAEQVRRWGIPAAGAAFVGIAAAPFLGANVGVAVWGTVGFSAAWALLGRRQVTWRYIGAVALLVLGAIALFSAVDLFAGGEQTHLGRALTGADQGGLRTLWTIIARKADTNARVLSSTGLTWLLAVVLALGVWARWRPGSDWPAMLAENPHFSAALRVAAITSVAAFFTEDSGIAIPALIALYVGVGLAWLMVARLASASSTPADGESR